MDSNVVTGIYLTPTAFTAQTPNSIIIGPTDNILYANNKQSYYGITSSGISFTYSDGIGYNFVNHNGLYISNIYDYLYHSYTIDITSYPTTATPTTTPTYTPTATPTYTPQTYQATLTTSTNTGPLPPFIMYITVDPISRIITGIYMSTTDFDTKTNSVLLPPNTYKHNDNHLDTSNGVDSLGLAFMVGGVKYSLINDPGVGGLVTVNSAYSIAYFGASFIVTSWPLTAAPTPVPTSTPTAVPTLTPTSIPTTAPPLLCLPLHLPLYLPTTKLPSQAATAQVHSH